MDKSFLFSDSTLTNRYQTTIPEVVRKALGLKKRDKIRYIVLNDGSVKITRLDKEKSDPVLTDFLTFLANDISQHPENINTVSTELAEQILPLVSDVDVDLDGPLSDEDE